jgi:hypothetical protein
VTAPSTPAATTPLTTDSAAGSVAAANTDSDTFTAIRDSIVAADEARRIRRERAAQEAERAAQAEREKPRTYTDSTGTVWTYSPPPPITSGTTPVVRPDTPATVTAPPPAAMSIVPRPDSVVKPKPDTIVKPKPDTIKVKPDTVRSR